MSIPNLTKDLAIIQKLSDLPNATDGLSAAELKAKFDEAALFIQSWLNDTFIPAVKAENIPFAASMQLNADNVQEAIEFVMSQISGASSGTIANGSVTKEKLSAELLARTFGGRPWVSLNSPASENNPAAEFPVGQIWLRPHFSFSNAAASVSWSELSDCTASVNGGKTTITGTGSAATVKAKMNLAGIGQANDRVYVLFDINDRNERITALNVVFNNTATETARQNSVYETLLTGSDLTIEFQAVFDSTNGANGNSFSIDDLTVVNVGKIMREVGEAEEIKDWGGYIDALRPLKNHTSPREMSIQTAAGVWQQFDYEVFPVNRGGTGVSEVSYGEILFGNGTGSMEKLKTPETEYSILQFTEGKPQWRTPDDVATSSEFARRTQKDYTGESGTKRKISFAFEPMILRLSSATETVYLLQGETKSKEYSGFYVSNTGVSRQEKYNAKITLSGNTLEFSMTDKAPDGGTWTTAAAKYFNEDGKTYTWTAIH